MLKRLALGLAALVLLSAPALAAPSNTVVSYNVGVCDPNFTKRCVAPNVDGSLNVTGSFSATLAGFTPNGNYGSLTATAASSASTALPTGLVVSFTNLNAVDVSCVLSAGAATATTNKLIVPHNSTIFVTVGSNVNTACINQTGTASNVLLLGGGTGLGTNFGGGGSSGSGGAVFGATAVGSPAANPPVIMGGTANAGATGNVQVWKVDSGGDGYILGGPTTIAHTCSVSAFTLESCLGQIDDDVKGPIPAGTAVIGYTNNDPCSQIAKSQADFESTTSGGSIITAVSAKKAYICSVAIVTSAAANVSLIEGTGSSVCTGGTTAGVYLNTGVTAANGAAFSANGAIRDGAGNATVAQNGTANQNICVLFTTTNTPQVNVHVTYVQQ